MDLILITLLETFLLVVALCVDAFVASLAYGANKIRMPLLSACIVSGISAGVLMLSLLCGQALGPYISAELTKGLCFAILLFLGTVKLFDSTLKRWISAHQSKEFQFSLFHLNFILNVYADPEQADQDHSKTLSPAEAVSLSLALSLDGLAAGFGAGLTSVPVLEAGAVSLLFGLGAVYGGYFLGRRLAKKSSRDLSWVSGLLLIVLACIKFF